MASLIKQNGSGTGPFTSSRRHRESGLVPFWESRPNLRWPAVLLSLLILLSHLYLAGCGHNSPGEPEEQTATAKKRLLAAETWMYQIQDLWRDGAIGALAASNDPFLVLEPTRTIRGDENFDTRGMIQQLRNRPDGKKRVILAYVDIGEAEDYRTYWKSWWRPPTRTDPGQPDFLLTEDPDSWSGNYPVAYWDARWQEIWIGPDGLVASLAADGFDGVYLDWVEAYDDSVVRQTAERQGIRTAEAMFDFIEKIRHSGMAIKKDFLVVVQNAPYLLDVNPDRYTALIDALAVEDTWFSGTGDAAWDNPAGGDIPNRNIGQYSTRSLLQQDQKYLERGLPVFSVDYCLKKENAAFVYREARRQGLRPLVTRVALSRMTETPP